MFLINYRRVPRLHVIKGYGIEGYRISIRAIFVYGKKQRKKKRVSVVDTGVDNPDVLPLIVRVHYVELHLDFRNFASDNIIGLHFSVSCGEKKDEIYVRMFKL